MDYTQQKIAVYTLPDIENKDMQHEQCEEFLEEKGHNMNNAYYMTSKLITVEINTDV